jgi:tetratricopeptide (TPR) repeat protein
LEPLKVAPSRALTDTVWSHGPVERPFDQAPAPQPNGYEVTRDGPTHDLPVRPYVEHTTDGPTGAMRAPTPAAESVDDPITSATAGTVLLRRLNRELGVLRNADAWTVLGIARRSSSDAIQVASQRMQHRYRTMSGDPSPEVSTLASEILARVQAAETELLTAKAAQSEGPLEGFLRRGQEELARGDWARADRYFSQARQAAPDHPLVLAHLGWARFHHPARPKDSREEEGTDYIELALQFDIDCAQAWQYRGEIAALRNDVAEARACFATATKLDPTFTGRRRK